MRKASFTLALCAVLLLVMFANGLLVITDRRYYGRPGITPPGNGVRVGTEQKGGLIGDGISEEPPVNLMVLGLDRDETRCDVIMLFNFNPVDSGLNILSIARDTRVVAGGRHAKINSLYAHGGEKVISEELTDITGLPVHYYITVDFEGFRKIIDTLGGVEFYVPFRMNYDDPTQNLHIHLKKGLQLLDGKKAEQLIRYRKGNGERQGYSEGDIGRIRMQQDFIRALIGQKLNFGYISKADDIFGILREYVKTNISIPDIAYYIGKIGKISSDGVRTYILPGESRMIGGVWYYLHDGEETENLIKRHFYS